MLTEASPYKDGRPVGVPQSSPRVRTGLELPVNLIAIAVMSATGIGYSAWITQRQFVWLVRTGLVGALCYSIKELSLLSKPQIEWIQLGEDRQYEYLDYFATWWKERERLRPPPKDPMVRALFQDERPRSVSPTKEDDANMVAVSLFDKSEKVQYAPQEEEKPQVTYWEAWKANLELIQSALQESSEHNRYVVGVWHEGALQAAMLLEHTDMPLTSISTPGSLDSVTVLALVTAPWNLHKNRGWAAKLFKEGLMGIFPKWINVNCKTETCEPTGYFQKKFGFTTSNDYVVLDRWALEGFCTPKQEETLNE